MRWLSLLAMLLLVPGVSAQENDAEKLYRAMEKKITGAKTLHLVCAGDIDAEFKGPFKVTVDFAEGKTRYELDRDGKILLIINAGNTRYQKYGDMVYQSSLDSSRLPGIAARLSACYTFFGYHVALPIEEWAPVKQFQLGAKEKVGKRQAQVVSYQIEIRRQPGKVSVWIDTETQLPLKRVVVLESEGKKTHRFTEKFSAFAVDGKIDAKLFEIPK